MWPHPFTRDNLHQSIHFLKYILKTHFFLGFMWLHSSTREPSRNPEEGEPSPAPSQIHGCHKMLVFSKMSWLRCCVAKKGLGFRSFPLIASHQVPRDRGSPGRNRKPPFGALVTLIITTQCYPAIIATGLSVRTALAP